MDPLIFFSPCPLHRSATLWGLRRDQDASLMASRTKRQAFQVLAIPNVSKGYKSFINEIIMVDPLEAKRLAAKQMAQIKTKEKFKVEEVSQFMKDNGHKNTCPISGVRRYWRQTIS